MRILQLLLTLLVFSSATCTQNQKPFNSTVECTVIKNVPYSSGAQYCGTYIQSQQDFDVYIPDNSPYGNMKPIVIYIHGGGFIGNDKNDILPYVKNNVNQILDNGIAFASINYRLLDLNNNCQNETCGVKDKCLDDVARCIKFIKANATAYGIDKNRIGLIGVSAGATSALWIGLDGFEKAYGSNNMHFGIPALDIETTEIKAIYCDVPQGSLDIREWDNTIYQGQCTTANLDQQQIINILTKKKKCYLHAMYGVGNSYPSSWPFIGINSYLNDVALIQLSSNSLLPKPKIYLRNKNPLNNLFGNPNANIINHHPLHANKIKNALVSNGFNVCWEIDNICNNNSNCQSDWFQFFNNNL